MSKPMTYLACPYSHDDPAVRLHRFELANLAAGALIRRGHKVYSPVSHTHPIAVCCALPLRWEYWLEFQRAFLEHTGLVVVLKLDGWDRSAGVHGELEIAEELLIPVIYRTMAELDKHGVLPIPD